MSTDTPDSTQPESSKNLNSEQEPRHSDGDTYRLSSPSPMIPDPNAPPLVVTPRPIPKKGVKKSKSADYWALWGYNGLVFLTSVCVMTLELTASRLIAKSVGSSLYTWTSVIGVVLAGITLGNFLGGWMADRFDRKRALAWMYLFGSVSCASVLWLDQVIAPLQRPAMMNWPTWVLTVVSMMFLLPSLALGTISPLVASMALARSSRVGTTVGNVYAWGALGSIIGTFLTGFYLIDVWGSRAIIGLTAGTLGILAAVVAGSPRLFRTAVVCGWLQFLGWTIVAATCTQQAMASVAETFGLVMTVAQSSGRAAEVRETWATFGGEVGTRFHELGLVLKLRNDQIGTYYDESNYSTIVVTDGEHQGHPVKHLHLDKLIHSYYDPAVPTALHYEYEQVYAAVTKRTARLLTQPVTLSTKSLPKEAFGASRLPTGTTYDPASDTLRVELPTQAVFDTLLTLAPDAPFWKAVNDLHKDTNSPLWGGFSASPLEQMPDGVAIPEELNLTIRHDKTLEVVTAYDIITAEIRDRLIQGTPSAAWYSEVQKARGDSRRATGMFMGGGGFIFPRWFLKEFPGSPRIEVAELDQAVYDVSIKALGLTPAEQQRILTSIGDARNFVDDRLRENQRLVAAGKTPVKYDFVYGDAFNDFSIPFHLTTREFLQKIHDLLSDDGVFQANIIEIYPRVDYPGTTAGVGEVTYKGPLPIALASISMPFDRYESAGKGFEPLEIKAYATGEFRIRATRTIDEKMQNRLMRVIFSKTNRVPVEWADAIESLARQTRSPLPFEGTIPASLQASDGPLEAWVTAKAPWECVEVCRLSSTDQTSQYALGFRGIVPVAIENELIDLDRHNEAWVKAVRQGARQSRQAGGSGRFMGRYVETAAAVFPNIYLFSTTSHHPGNGRDTFVMVCSRKPLDLQGLSDTGDWNGDWFAALETPADKSQRKLLGQMAAVLTLGEGQMLTDDFAPVDNLLRPVVAEQ